MATSQIAFYRNYANNGFDFGQGIVQLEDSSYVIAGTSGSFSGSAQAFLMQVDSTGERIWSNHYGGSETEWGRRVLYKENVGFYLCGHSNSFGSGDYDFYMVKVDESGLEEWSETYGDQNWERLMDASMTRDTGVVMVGEKQNGSFAADMHIVRTNTNGDTLWTKTIENPGDDIATSVSIHQDSIIYVAGTRYHADSSQVKAIVYKIHDDGTMMDTLFFDQYPGSYELNDMQIVGDTLQALGSHQQDTNDEWDYTFFRSELTVNGFGNVFCYNSIVSGNWYGDAFTTYGNGNNSRRYMAVSFDGTPSTLEGGRDVQVQRTNSFLFYQDAVGFLAQTEPDVSGEFIQTSDGGAILVGYQQSLNVGSGGGTIFLLKIGPDEFYPATDAIVSHSALVSIAENPNNIGVAVYPNPSNEFLYLELPDLTRTSYDLISITGNLILSGDLQGKTKIDVGNIPSGIYLLKVRNEKGESINRVVIQ